MVLQLLTAQFEVSILPIIEVCSIKYDGSFWPIKHGWRCQECNSGYLISSFMSNLLDQPVSQVLSMANVTKQKEFVFLYRKERRMLPILETDFWRFILRNPLGIDQWSSWAKLTTHCNWRKWLWSSYISSLLAHLLTFLQLSGAHQTCHWANSIPQPGRKVIRQKNKSWWLSARSAVELAEWKVCQEPELMQGRAPDHTAKCREGEKKNQDHFR